MNKNAAKIEKLNNLIAKEQKQEVPDEKYLLTLRTELHYLTPGSFGANTNLSFPDELSESYREQLAESLRLSEQREKERQALMKSLKKDTVRLA